MQKKNILIGLVILVLFTLYGKEVEAENPDEEIGSIEKSEFIFSGKSGMRDGWDNPAWHNPKWAWKTVVTIDNEIVRKLSEESLRIDYESDKGAWGGARLIVGGARLIVGNRTEFFGAIEVKPSDFEKGVLRFFINGGKNNVSKEFEGGQRIAIKLQYLLKDGSEYKPKDKSGGPLYIKIDPFIKEGDSIDNDPETWQEVSIPLNKFVGEGQLLDEVEAIVSISIQFHGREVPQSGIYLTDIQIGGLG